MQRSFIQTKPTINLKTSTKWNKENYSYIRVCHVLKLRNIFELGGGGVELIPRKYHFLSIITDYSGTI